MDIWIRNEEKDGAELIKEDGYVLINGYVEPKKLICLFLQHNVWQSELNELEELVEWEDPEHEKQVKEWFTRTLTRIKYDKERV